MINPTVGLVVLLGCHAEPPPTLPVEDAWLQIADASYARAHSNVTKHTALPFDFQRDGIDGTQLMLQFLGTAETRGAAYASKLAIVLQLVHNGTPLECVSKIVPVGRAPGKDAAPDNDTDTDTDGTTTFHAWKPDLVTAQVDDHAYACERKATRPEATESIMETDYTAQQKLLIQLNTPSDPEPISADWYDECHLVPQHHEVRRYEHFVVAHFQPPDLDKLGTVFTTKKLVELPPECHVIASVSKPFQRIEADLGYSGQGPKLVPKLMPDRLKPGWISLRPMVMR